ncbi:MAG: NeuD/PglB/VioB family sugar acetyltransferase [Spirochaetota bacterium]
MIFKKIHRYKTNKIVIWGAGGISKEVAFLIEDINEFGKGERYQILGFIEKDRKNENVEVSGYKILGEHSILNDIECHGFVLPVGNPVVKMRIFRDEIMNKDLIAFNFIHPSVIKRSQYIKFGQGNIVCAGSILTTDISIGDFNLINLNCTIGHDAVIGNFNVINPIVAISGGVKIGSGVLVGTGAKILQNLEICNNVIIGAGAIVTKSITTPGTYTGIPARRI